MLIHNRLLLLCFLLMIAGCAREAVKLNAPISNQKPLIARISKGVNHKDPIKKKEMPDTLAIQGPGTTTVYIQKPMQSNWFKDVFPIFTLLLGIGINKGLDYLSERKKIKKAGKRWHAELLSIEKPLNEQIKNLESALLDHQANPMQPPRIVSNAQLDGESFQSLDKSELLAYVNRYYKKKYHDAIELTNQINFFISITKSNKETLKKRFDEFIENYGKRHEKFNGNLQELYKALIHYSLELKNSEGEEVLHGPKFKPLDDLFGEHLAPFLEDGKLNYLEFDKKFLIPMLKELDKLSADSRVVPIMNFSRHCLDNIKGIKMENLYFSTNLQTIIDFFKEDKQKLLKILLDLAVDKKRRRIFF